MPPARGQDYTILQALFSVDMLVLFMATICGVGGTLTAVDNMGQIGQSLGYPQRSILYEAEAEASSSETAVNGSKV